MCLHVCVFVPCDFFFVCVWTFVCVWFSCLCVSWALGLRAEGLGFRVNGSEFGVEG